MTINPAEHQAQQEALTGPEELETIGALVKRLGISIESEPVSSNPNMPDSANMYSYRVTLSRACQIGMRTLTTYYSVGAGIVEASDAFKRSLHNRIPSLAGHDSKATLLGRAALKYRPDVASVVDCLVMDACGYDNAQNFEDWVADYGYDSDSRKAYAIYTAIADAAKALRHFLGDDYESALYETESL